MSFAELTAIGNVGKVPEVRYSPDGREFCHFSVAVNEGTGKKDKDGKTIKETTWYNVTCINSLVNLATTYLKKGDSVFVRGKLKVRKYSGSNGMDVSLDLFATTIQLMQNSRANEHDSVDAETDNTDFNPEQYEQEIAQELAQVAGSNIAGSKTTSSNILNASPNLNPNPSPSPNRNPSNKAAEAPTAK